MKYYFFFLRDILLIIEKKRCIGYLLIAITPVNILWNLRAAENQQLTSHEVLWPASDFHVQTTLEEDLQFEDKLLRIHYM